MAVVLITGGSGDIGRAVASMLAGSGDVPVIGGRDIERATRTAAAIPGAAAVQLDPTDGRDCHRAIEEIVGRHGAIDGVVCAAAVFRFASANELESTDFEEMLNVNVIGSLLPCQAAARWMIEADRPGSMVLLSSSAARRAVGAPAYSASKGAVESLTRELALGWAPNDIRVNCVSPGLIQSAMSRPALSDPVTFSHFMRHTPLARPGRPEEVAATVAFLLRDESLYITASIVPTDGGFLSR
jgi:NAD(P)-dependent dehydrogenase (short-subunit alcohol dehydrogenase family)